MEEFKPVRKPNRIKNYDYSSRGAYFLTLCVKEREPILSTIPLYEKSEFTDVGAPIGRPLDWVSVNEKLKMSYEPILTDI